MDDELKERVRLERVELIARLATVGICQERDREIALSLIAEIAADAELRNRQYAVIFSSAPLDR